MLSIRGVKLMSTCTTAFYTYLDADLQEGLDKCRERLLGKLKAHSALRGVPHGRGRGGGRAERHLGVGGCRLTFESNGLKALYFQGVETKHFQRGVNLMSTCTAAQPRCGEILCTARIICWGASNWRTSARSWEPPGRCSTVARRDVRGGSGGVGSRLDCRLTLEPPRTLDCET